MPPSSAAIWLADSPSVHSRLSVSTRSSVQVMASNPSPVGAEKSGQSPPMGRGTDACPRRPPPLRFTLVTCPPHDMSYLLIERLQYGESQAQEAEVRPPTCSSTAGPCIRTYLLGCRAARRGQGATPAPRIMLTVDVAAIKYQPVPPGEAAHFI